MAILESAQLGSIVFDPRAVIRFPAGLPAFENENEFLLVEREALAPVVFLQSVRNPALSFILLPMMAVDPHYALSLTGEDSELLGGAGAPLLVLAMVTIGEDRRVTANLMAPVVINPEASVGVQVLQPDAGYSHVHPVASPDGGVVCS